MFVRKTRPLPIECVVRGYLSGSGWQEYQSAGRVCGSRYRRASSNRTDCLNPSSRPRRKRSRVGTTENISFDRVVEAVGPEVAEQVRSMPSPSTTGSCRGRGQGDHHRRHKNGVRRGR